MAKITSPNPQYCGISATVTFVNGVGETDDLRLIEWFKTHGYQVENSDPDPEPDGGDDADPDDFEDGVTLDDPPPKKGKGSKTDN